MEIQKIPICILLEVSMSMCLILTSGMEGIDAWVSQDRDSSPPFCLPAAAHPDALDKKGVLLWGPRGRV